MLKYVSEIATKLKQSQGFRLLSEEQVVQYLELVHAELCGRYSLYRQSFNIDLTASVQSYSLHPSIRRIWEARYHTSATDFVPLEGVNRDVLHQSRPGALEDTNTGDPVEFWAEGTTLGLVQLPATTTDVTSGYPRIELDCAVLTPICPTGKITSDLTIPSGLADGSYYVHAVRHEYADDRMQDVAEKEVGIWQGRADRAKQRKLDALRAIDRYIVSFNTLYHFTPSRKGEMFGK